MSKKGQHVVPNRDGWSVRKSGSSRATAVYGTQKEAIDKAREIARNQKTELYVHGRDVSVVRTFGTRELVF